jgi:hypothetical protein
LVCEREIAEVTAETGMQMPEYRAYVVASNGHFITAIQLYCADDNTAKKAAKQFVDGHDIELWSGRRFIVRLSHKTE